MLLISIEIVYSMSQYY